MHPAASTMTGFAIIEFIPAYILWMGGNDLLVYIIVAEFIFITITIIMIIRFTTVRYIHSLMYDLFLSIIMINSFNTQ